MVLFLNGPVQNGDFTFHSDPGKAVGIRLTSALNNVLGHPEAPHLWNTVTLAGDVRHRAQDRAHTPSRTAFEHACLMNKYEPAMAQPSSVITDADPGVAALALTMIDKHLSSGILRIDTTTIQECASCGHMVGFGATQCTSCSSEYLRTRSARHLIKDNIPGQAALPPELLHMHNRRHPRHLDATSRHVPRHLLLSRTRAHGVHLDALGLGGLVLDPRACLHVTALFAAQQRGAEMAAMTVTPNALGHIAAYARGFTDHHGHQLRYALHGRIPYNAVPGLRRTYEFHRANDHDQRAFETWFLPLLSLRNKDRTHAGQLPAVLKYFLKVRRADTRDGDSERVKCLRTAIMAGGSNWVMNKQLLAAAMSTNGRPMTHV